MVYAAGRSAGVAWGRLSQPLQTISLPPRVIHFSAAAVMLILTVVTFINLGDTITIAPNHSNEYSDRGLRTGAWRTEDGTASVDLGVKQDVTSIIFMNGVTENRTFGLSHSADGVEWSEEWLLDSGSVFAWHEIDVNFTAKYIKITPISHDVMLLEMGFRNNNSRTPIYIHAVHTGNSWKTLRHGLFDEQHLIPDTPSFMNSTYFDEIYHARTAYEFVHGLWAYETTHPPLGKVIIAAGVSLFGMNPFGFRVMGAVFGLLMLPLMYVFARRLTGGRFSCHSGDKRTVPLSASFWALFAMGMLAVDFMRFSQTRMATVDVFLTFFILAAFYFMYCYTTTAFDAPLRKLFLPLALSGLFMGLAVSVKWSGVYAGLGLAAVFFLDLWHRHKDDAGAFKSRVLPVIGSCFIFFAAVPVAVYVLSYIPFLGAPGMDGLRSVWQNQISMFEYHSQLTQRHPFESPWWQWPLNIRPVFLYAARLSGGLSSAISVMGNPVVWYAGLVAVLYALFNRPDRATVFLLTAFGAQILPWVPVDRCTFIYHYFPCVAFMILLLTKALAQNNKRRAAAALLASAFLLFVVYYPVLSGAPADPEFVRTYLQWIPTWNIIY